LIKKRSVGAKKIFRILLILAFILVTGFNLQAQGTFIDTVGVNKKKAVPEEIHSPKKAAVYSAILPGLGQAYNKKYWKIPIVYAGFGVIGYSIGWNNDNYKLVKTAYIHLTDNDETTTDYLKLKGIEYYDLNNPGDLTVLRTALTKRQAYYRRNRDLLVIGMVAFYGINIIDASVDAHLFNFDISDDLTMNWQPSLLKINNELVYCVNFSINF
jgi:hypothetical protein